MHFSQFSGVCLFRMSSSPSSAGTIYVAGVCKEEALINCCWLACVHWQAGCACQITGLDRRPGRQRALRPKGCATATCCADGRLQSRYPRRDAARFWAEFLVRSVPRSSIRTASGWARERDGAGHEERQAPAWRRQSAWRSGRRRRAGGRSRRGGRCGRGGPSGRSRSQPGR